MSDYSKYLTPLVSCLTCREVKSAKGIFSHFIASHTAEGKDTVIKAGKASKFNKSTQKQNAANLRLNYSKNPNLCICNSPKSYKPAYVFRLTNLEGWRLVSRLHLLTAI